MDLEKLTSYILYFSDDNSVYYNIVPPKQIGKKTFIFGAYNYSDKLESFVHDVYESGIMCKNYPEIIERIDDFRGNEIKIIKEADYKTVSAILTYYIRNHRFNEVIWAWCCDNKIFLAILERLSELIV